MDYWNATLEILHPEEIERIERDYANGLSARAILGIFQPRGVRLSEATFRKYVQAGLLPRSVRVGRKGKHRGSQGVYPVEAVRRINAIKKMMAEGHTLEDIRGSFVVFKNRIDALERGLAAVFGDFRAELDRRLFSERAKKSLGEQLLSLEASASELSSELTRFGSIVTARNGIST